MIKLVFFVPIDSKEIVKNALFEAGAGKIGCYDQCCFEVVGKGQFRALEGANPTVGRVNETAYVDEVRVEMIVDHGSVHAIRDALLGAHPYEEPAYEFYQTLDV